MHALLNAIYRKGEDFPKKPVRLLMNNTNLMHVMTPGRVDRQDMMETFFQSAVGQTQGETRRQVMQLHAG